MSNRLASAQSAYLKSAAHQPVEWYPWCDEAFARARELDRPILLDIGAVWCHWCHVMDGESYENPDTAKIINELYIAIKVDRDERPDIDRRYQEAVSAITGQGGWPLTAFLTPDGEVFFGGTYFPPTERYGRRGFPTVLSMVADYYHNSRDNAHATARQLTESIADRSERLITGELSSTLLGQGLARATDMYDSVNGGFGSAPKFPHPTILEVLLNRSYFSGDPSLNELIRTTLLRMARGGMYDQIGGGFHRYSTDAKWIVPHFEKMSYDNSELLRVYATAARRFNDPELEETAHGIIRFMTDELSDQMLGGFYASQDADVGLDDDGDYFTWTIDEVRAVCTPRETAALVERFDIRPEGEMHHNTAKNVLFVAAGIDVIAAKLNISETAVSTSLDSGIQRLREERRTRAKPFIDRSIYAGWNGMAISAFLIASDLLDLEDAREFALKSLDRVISTCLLADGRVRHSASMDEPIGLLEDGVFVARACLDAYHSIGDERHLTNAKSIAQDLQARLWDQSQGGFFDLAAATNGTGLLAQPRKPIQDAPTPSANGIAAEVFQRLYEITGDSKYHEAAEAALGAFAGLAPQLGIFGGAYYLALDRFLRGGAHAVVSGAPTDPAATAMWKSARSSTRPYLSILRIDSGRPLPDTLPSEMQSIWHAGAVRGYFCVGNTCAQPAATAEEFSKLLESLGR